MNEVFFFKMLLLVAATVIVMGLLALTPGARPDEAEDPNWFKPANRVRGLSLLCAFATAVLVVAAMVAPGRAQAAPADVGREFVCNPADGRQTCMQGVLLVDDITMAVLAGAPDHLALDTARWVTQSDFREELGYLRYTQRVTQLAFRDGLSLSPLSAVVNRRVEVNRAKRFLIPVGPVETLKIHGQPGFVRLVAKDMDSRTRYSPEGADICSTTLRARFCVRLPDVKGITLSQLWNRVPAFMTALFEGMTPHFMSTEWMSKTMLAVEVEMLERTPVSIDGARVVTARPVSLVVYNLGYLAGSKSALVLVQSSPGEQK